MVVIVVMTCVRIVVTQIQNTVFNAVDAGEINPDKKLYFVNMTEYFCMKFLGVLHYEFLLFSTTWFCHEMCIAFFFWWMM